MWRGEWRGVRIWLVVALSIAALSWVAIGTRYLVRLEPLTGDEPYYVMTAISLLEDGDLNEANNYAAREWLRFYPPRPLPANWQGWPSFPWELPPHAARAVRPGLYSKHGLGLTLLIAVPWELAGRVGAMAVVGLCGLLLVGQLWLLAREAGASPGWATVVALGLGLTMPIGPYALLLFPEVPAALGLVYAVRRLSSPENRWWQWVLTGCAIGFLPWLHQRFVFSAGVLGLALLGRAIALGQRRGWGRPVLPSWIGVGLAASGGLGIVAYNVWLYGTPYQNPADHAGFNGLAGTVNGLAGLFLDAQWGLLVAAPVYLFAVPAMRWWWLRQRGRVALMLGAVLPYLVLVAAYRVWWGEWGPPARYLVPIVGFAAAPLGSWLARARWWGRVIVVLVWTWGGVLSAIGYLDPQRFYHHPDGVNKLYQAIGQWLGIDLAGRLVPFQPYAIAPFTARALAVAVGLSLLLGAMGIVGGAVRSREAETASAVEEVR